MSSEVEKSGTPRTSQSDDDLTLLEEDYQKLLEDSQNLINERSYLETEIRTLKKRATRLDDEVRLLKTPPLIIGHLQDVLDERNAIVRSSHGTVF